MTNAHPSQPGLESGEAEARTRIADALDREAIMWNKRGDDMTNTMARAVCYSLANEAAERAKAQRKRANSLRLVNQVQQLADGVVNQLAGRE